LAASWVLDGYLFTLAVGAGWDTIWAPLLSQGVVNPSAGDGEALRVALDHGRVEAVKSLLSDERVDPSVGDSRCFVKSGVGFDWDEDERVEAYALVLKDGRANPAARNNEIVRQTSGSR
jgi:hypothetical protein